MNEGTSGIIMEHDYSSPNKNDYDHFSIMESEGTMPIKSEEKEQCKQNQKDTSTTSCLEKYHITPEALQHTKLDFIGENTTINYLALYIK